MSFFSYALNTGQSNKQGSGGLATLILVNLLLLLVRETKKVDGAEKGKKGKHGEIPVPFTLFSSGT